MERFHRYYKLHGLLSRRSLPVPRSEIERELECSRATAKRVIEDLRCYGAPIDYVRGRGYAYRANSAFELPGIWFTQSELFALLVAHQLLVQAEPGLLGATLAPLRRQVERMLSAEYAGDGELIDRVVMMRMGGRGVGAAFMPAVTALATRRCLRASYKARQSGAEQLRTLSPQRLIHYRDNWYLDAWCHERQALRRFALERLKDAELTDAKSKTLDLPALDRQFGAGYGIFAGPARQSAVLRFNAERARWIADELWHPEQAGHFLPDGRFELRVPYADARELVMDILRNGDDVEVIGPAELRAEVVRKLARALEIYRDGLIE